MILKAALKEPVLYAESVLSELSDVKLRSSIKNHIQSLTCLSDKHRSLVLEQQITSRKIGEIRARGEDASTLISSMKGLSDEAKFIRNRTVELLREIENIEHATSKAKCVKDSANIEDELTVPAYFEKQPEEVFSEAVTVTDQFTSAEYDKYVRGHSKYTAYHDLRMKDVIESNTKQACVYFVARDTTDTVRGVLPLVVISSHLFGNYAVSMPWFNYGGVLADSSEIATQLMLAAQARLGSKALEHIEFRDTCEYEGWSKYTNKVSMTLALPKSTDQFNKIIGSSIRSQSDKARKNGCTIKFGRSELLKDFLSVFAVRMRDLGTPIHSSAFFESLMKEYEKETFIAVVYQNGTAISVGFLLSHGSTIEIPWASSLTSSNSIGANMYLYRNILCESIRRGYSHFDFGRSTVDSNTWRFKKQWGAKESQLYWHRWYASGDSSKQSDLSVDNPKYKFGIAVWRKLPVWLTRLMGPLLIRGLP